MNYYCENNLNQNKSLLYTNNNNISTEMDTQTGCSKSLDSNEEHPNLNDDNCGVESDNSDSDEMFVNSWNNDAEDDQLSSPSNSHNSDVDQRWYAFRGRFVGIHNDNRPLDNHLPENQPQQPPAQQQEEEETDFLEMDFEPDTNSEIENEAKFSDYVLPNGHHHSAASHNFQHLPPPQDFLVPSNSNREDPPSFCSKNTGARPKQLSTAGRQVKESKHVSNGDHVFKISTHNIDPDPSHCHPSTSFCTSDVYNLGASSSRDTYQSSHELKFHKSPSKSTSHHNSKHLRLQEDQFLFEIEPIKPRNSVTIYTTNCDEKILMDALTSLNMNPNRDMIAAYFNKSKSPSESAELNLVDFIIHRSKMNCNYLKLVELIQKSCRSEDDDDYSDKNFEVNFYPLDLFSTMPEMIEVEVDEIVQRWTPQTDLSPLIIIRNKYFHQTNVLGKIVNIIRKINQKPPGIFKEKETIKIPQYYVAGYITITNHFATNHGYKSS